MKPLPTKAKTPLRMASATVAPVNGHAHLAFESRHEPPRATVPPDHVPPLKLLRFPAVKERTGLSRWTISRLERRGGFPRHHRISANAVAWVEEEVIYWIRCKVGSVAV
jgi:prophage regulatory protein